MPAPQAWAVRVPFYYVSPKPSDDLASADNAASNPPLFITNVTLELLAFGERFFWLHVSESLAAQHVPRLGSCSVAVGLSLRGTEAPSSISSSQLMEFEAARPQDMSTGTNTSVQSAFATGLSQKLVRGVAKRFGMQVTVYVHCAVEGERCLSLLGTDGGSGFDMTFQFGGLIYREALAMVARHLEGQKGGLVI